MDLKLKGNRALVAGSTSGIGTKAVSINPKEVAPQALNKTMTATQDTDHSWNIIKSPSPASLSFTNTCDPLGSPLSQGQFMTTTAFAEANPKIVQALRNAAEEAKAFIQTSTPAAGEIYREVTGDKTSTEQLLELLKQPGMMEWNIYPQGTMKFAEHLARIGGIKTKPASWKDYYLPIAHDLPGN